MSKEVWKMKFFIEKMKELKGLPNCVSLIVPPHQETLESTLTLLHNERAKKQGNPALVESLTNIQKRLSTQYNCLPKNGLLLFMGTVFFPNDRKLLFDIEPFRPVKTFVFKWDTKFHVDSLYELLCMEENAFGFIIMDREGCLFGKILENTKIVLQSFHSDLPKKHIHEKKNNEGALRKQYFETVNRLALQHFLPGNEWKVEGLIVAGKTDIKKEWFESEFLDKRLKSKILKILDISYGKEAGFHQAISEASDILKNVRLVEEQKWVQRFFQEISRDSGKYCYGLEETIELLDRGAIEVLLIWDQCPLKIPIYKNEETGEESIFGKINQISQGSELFLDWIYSHFREFGVQLESISDSSSEGKQFVEGFGLGGLLRYR
jgi:peptide chain release factor subunit 1